MSLLYLTADRVGIETGGGLVTHHEATALKSMGECEVWDHQTFVDDSIKGTFVSNEDTQEPWYFDAIACKKKDWFVNPPKLVHVYAGTFSKTVDVLRRNGCKITYTAAAHDVAASRREHELLGLQYNYPHLTDPELWKRYLEGYKQADCLICPSQHSVNVMRGFGCTNRIEVIPHGVNIPTEIKPLPDTFVIGYLGAIGPDKGLRYLLEAWKKLAYKDAVLRIAGRDSTSPFMMHLIDRFGGGNIQVMGWQENIEDFYSSISLYVQPSVSEGWGLEVTEAMAHGRTVLCSRGAGAADAVPENWRFHPANTDDLAGAIDYVKTRGHSFWEYQGRWARTQVDKYQWHLIRQRYVNLWRSLLGT